MERERERERGHFHKGGERKFTYIIPRCSRCWPSTKANTVPCFSCEESERNTLLSPDKQATRTLPPDRDVSQYQTETSVSTRQRRQSVPDRDVSQYLGVISNVVSLARLEEDRVVEEREVGVVEVGGHNSKPLLSPRQ